MRGLDTPEGLASVTPIFRYSAFAEQGEPASTWIPVPRNALPLRGVVETIELDESEWQPVTDRTPCSFPEDLITLSDIMFDAGREEEGQRLLDDFTNGILPEDWRVSRGVVCSHVQKVLKDLGLGEIISSSLELQFLD